MRDKDFFIKIRFPVRDGKYIVGMKKECWKNNFCQGIKFYTIISSDGEVYPCWRMWGNKKYSYGSLYEKTFKDIWKGKTRKKIEKYINNTPPIGDECAVCNHFKINEILNNCLSSNKWRGFLI